MWPVISLILRWLIIAYAAVVGIGVALASLHLIEPLPKLEASVWIISLVVLGIENAGTIVVRAFRSRRAKRTVELETAIQAALLQIVGHSAVHLEEIGGNVYMASRWDRWRQKPHDKVRLKRIARLRPGGYPQESGVAWAAGKGVVGECWSKKKRIHKPWHAVAARYADAELDEASFAKIPAATRYGFTFQEFVSIVDKYAEVLAEPIWDSRKKGTMLGVISIDRAYRSQPAPYISELNAGATHESAGYAARVVSRILKPRPIEE